MAFPLAVAASFLAVPVVQAAFVVVVVVAEGCTLAADWSIAAVLVAEGNHLHCNHLVLHTGLVLKFRVFFLCIAWRDRP